MSATRTLGPLQWAIILLAAATALIHIALAFRPEGVDPIFLLNGIGYLGLVTLLYLPVPSIRRYQPVVRWVLMAFAAVTILGWVLIGVRSPIAYVDKIIEVALIVCLWLDRQRSRR